MNDDRSSPVSAAHAFEDAGFDTCRFCGERKRHPDHSSPADRALLLIQQLAWYYDVNDCSERHEDDAIEVPLLDLRAAKEIAAELNLPDGPVPVQRGALTSAHAQCVPSRIDKGRAFYLAMYEKDGAVWAANDHKGLWCDMAEDYERRLSTVTSGSNIRSHAP